MEEDNSTFKQAEESAKIVETGEESQYVIEMYELIGEALRLLYFAA